MATSDDGSDEVEEQPAKRRKFEGTEKVSDRDIKDVASNAKLLHDQLRHLFVQLGIKASDRENAERRADTRDFKLQAIEVLRSWRQSKGEKATRKAILHALRKCHLMEAREILVEKWAQSKDFRKREPLSQLSSSPCQHVVSHNQPLPHPVQHMVPSTPYANPFHVTTAAATACPGFNLEECKKELITFYQYKMSRVQLLPWYDEEFKDISNIYVPLELKEGSKKSDSLLLNEDIVSLQTSNDLPATRILLKGGTGSGKSTLLAKLAYTWSQQISDSPLANHQLLFILRLREVQIGSSLIDEIFNQIFESNTRVPKDGLKAYIESNPQQVLLLLDGFDEFSAMGRSTPVGSFEEILAFKSLRECRTILSSRPYKDLDNQSSYMFLIVNVFGFSQKNVELYVNKFFSGNDEIVQGLKERITASEQLTSLSFIPVILMLMCLLWEDEQKLPDTQSELYKEFILFFNRKYCTSQGKNENFDDILSGLGNIALGGLCQDHDIIKEQIVFTENDFEKSKDFERSTSLFQLGCQIGLLTRERLRSKLSRESAVSFLHRSFQEYCAAMHLAKLYDTDLDRFNKILSRLKPWPILLSKIDLLKFFCGLVRSSAGLVSVMKHATDVYSQFNRNKLCIRYDMSRSSIVNILTLLHEGHKFFDDRESNSFQDLLSNEDGLHLSTESSALEQLTQLFKSIFPHAGFTVYIDDKHPKSTSIFHNFVKSNIGCSILSRVRWISIINPQLSQSVIADTLRCMAKITNVQMCIFSDDAKQIKQTPSLFTAIQNCVSALLIHLSDSFYKDNYTFVKLSSIQLTVSNMSKLLSSLANFKSLDLDDISVVPVVQYQGRIQKPTTLGGSEYIQQSEWLECAPNRDDLNGRTIGHIRHLSLRRIPDDKERSTDFQKQTPMSRQFHFELRHCKVVSDEFTQLLCDHVINNCIQVIDLCNSDLTEDQIKILSKCLSRACDLQKLDLSHNTLGKAIQPLSNSLQYCKNISELNLSQSRLKEEHIETLNKFLPKLPILQVLDLSENVAGIVFAPVIFQTLKYCSKLTTLNIKMGAIDNLSFQYIADEDRSNSLLPQNMVPTPMLLMKTVPTPIFKENFS
ncbi:NLR family CARD domain-containing protein 4-like [Amphiura filiformis]|uniref:NLR family CARD domain-containing protein 4-like n=1 Tax=Amphiura filiformis TaxID=82378 RepID=UPI003B21134A